MRRPSKEGILQVIIEPVLVAVLAEVHCLIGQGYQH